MEVKNNFFSLIIPVYNIENYIEKCLDSLVNQTFKDFEVLLIDDGSLDKSGEICNRYCEQNSNWRVIHKENGGVSSARNIGIHQAKGCWIVFIDGDDCINVDFLETFFEMSKFDIDMGVIGVSVGAKNIILNGDSGENGLHGRTWGIKLLVKRNGVRGFLFNKCFSSRILKDNQIFFDENIHMCEDLLFCMQYITCCKTICFQNVPSYNYTQRKNSASRSKVNLRRLSVLDAYSDIIKLVKLYGDKESLKISKANYLIHNAHIYLMLRKNEEYMEIKYKISKYIIQNIKDIFIKNIEVKAFVVVVIAYVLCLAQIKRVRK